MHLISSLNHQKIYLSFTGGGGFFLVVRYCQVIKSDQQTLKYTARYNGFLHQSNTHLIRYVLIFLSLFRKSVVAVVLCSVLS